MTDVPAKPVIFISYSHQDEPEYPGPREVQWLTFVKSHLGPSVADGRMLISPAGWNRRGGRS